jgi:DNA repair photolyase
MNHPIDLEGITRDQAVEVSSIETMSRKPVLYQPSRTVLTYPSEAFQEKLLCDGLTLNLGNACVYSCSFCYVESQMRKLTHQVIREHNEKHQANRSHEDLVIRRFGHNGEKGVQVLANQLAGDVKGWLSRRAVHDLKEMELVLYSSTLVDVAANMELLKETAEACQLILDHTRWQIRLLTKGNLIHKLLKDGMIEDKTRPGHHLSHHQRLILGFSTGTLNDSIAAAFEKGTARVSKRVESLHWLQDHGYRTFGMICPSLPQEDYEAFSRSMVQALRPEKMEHVWAEVINVRGESFTRTRDALKEAGFEKEARMLEAVSEGPAKKENWEAYARKTFEAHQRQFGQKLRFLQYVEPRYADYWKAQKEQGAVLIGKYAKDEGLCSHERSAAEAGYQIPAYDPNQREAKPLLTPGKKAAETRARNKAAQEVLDLEPGHDLVANQAAKLIHRIKGVACCLVMKETNVVACEGGGESFKPERFTVHQTNGLTVVVQHEQEPDELSSQAIAKILNQG